MSTLVYSLEWPRDAMTVKKTIKKLAQKIMHYEHVCEQAAALHKTVGKN